MIAFQINMTFGHFTADYLQTWLLRLAGCGYDTIVWEVEDAVRWDTCPEVASADAFTKEEFRAILDFATDLGLTSIPLLQTFSHCEYVLRHKEYYHLSEHPEFVELYCPLKSEVKVFLGHWIDEYLEVFGAAIPFFHLGGDEAWPLGGKFCDGLCPEYMKNHSVSELYVQHLDAISKPLLERGIRPAIWADMLLKHGDALTRVSRETILFDWQYLLRPDVNKVWVWENPQGLKDPEEMPDELKIKYQDYLPNIFYTADFLQDQGFTVIGCPASSSSGDNVFAPRSDLHINNTAGWMSEYLNGKTDGLLLTSWSSHLFPFEMQLPSILLPGYMQENPGAKLGDFESYFCQMVLGTDSVDFFEAVRCFDEHCLFSHTVTLGYNSYHRVIPGNHVETFLGKVNREEEALNCQQRLAEYRRGLDCLRSLTVSKGKEIVDLWMLQAENLIHRARISLHILTGEGDREALLDEMKVLKERTASMYQGRLKSRRANEVIYWQFDCIEKYLTRQRE